MSSTYSSTSESMRNKRRARKKKSQVRRLKMQQRRIRQQQLDDIDQSYFTLYFAMISALFCISCQASVVDEDKTDRMKVKR
mmetsp:Transcript_30614/g.35697  ORF Transcript_30614/g.35697 Transcript_30614/m.35697 type:complete len:81 (-) Transcript_30614:148-390(-)